MAVADAYAHIRCQASKATASPTLPANEPCCTLAHNRRLNSLWRHKLLQRRRCIKLLSRSQRAHLTAMAAPLEPAGEMVTAERAWAWRLTSRYNNRRVAYVIQARIFCEASSTAGPQCLLHVQTLRRSLGSCNAASLREWSTHAGDWTIYKGTGAVPENEMRHYRALRLFKLDGELYHAVQPACRTGHMMHLTGTKQLLGCSMHMSGRTARCAV